MKKSILCMLIVCVAAGFASAETWTAGGATTSWDEGVNWDTGQAPANPTTSAIEFNDVGAVTDETVTNTVTATAKVVSQLAEPFVLSGDEILQISVGGISTLSFLTPDQFANIAEATAQEVATALSVNTTGLVTVSAVDGKVVIEAVDPSADSITIENSNGDPAGAIGLPLGENLKSWTIGTMTFKNSDEGDVTPITHTTDLDGGKLIVDGEMRVSYYETDNLGDRSTTTARFINGTLQVGMPDAKRAIYIGRERYAGTQNHGVLVVAPGSVFEGYLTDIVLSNRAKASGELDLRGVEIAGGILRADTLQIAIGGQSGGIQKDCLVKLDATTSINGIELNKGLYISDHSGGNIMARFGDPANDWKLPPNVNINIGSRTSRGKMVVGRAKYSTANGLLEASEGGDFNAYLDEMTVGWKNNSFGSVNAKGILDVSAMNSCYIDATTVNVGTGPLEKIGGTLLGKLMLPTGSTLVAGTAKIGDNSPNTVSLLDLPDSDMQVNTALAVNKKGHVVVTLTGRSCGIDLSDMATFSIDDGGLVDIVYAAPADAGTDSYYGLRWKGDHENELMVMLNAGKIAISGDFAEETYAPVYDAATDYTTISAVQELPITVVTRDLTLEVASPDYESVVIYPEDVENGSFDPSGSEIVSYEVTCPADETPAEPFVTLSGVGSYTLTLTVTTADNRTASGPCQVDVVEPASATTADVVWSGGASLSSMERIDWFLGGNWEGMQPPANPTDATVTFSDQGTGTNRLLGRATMLSSRNAPFQLVDGDTLTLAANGGAPVTITFNAADFEDISQATLQEVIDVINASAQGFRAVNYNGRLMIKSDPAIAASLTATESIFQPLGLPTQSSGSVWQIGQLLVRHPDLTGTYGDIAHTFDLQGGKLAVTGDVRIAYYDSGSNTAFGNHDVTITNGTLQIGTTESSSNLIIGRPAYGAIAYGSLTMAPGTVLEAYLNNIDFGAGWGTTGVLDLRDASVAGDVLKANNIYMATGNNGGKPRNPSEIRINEATGLTAIEVANSLELAHGSGNCSAYIGDPDNDWLLPANIDVTIGDSSMSGNLYIARSKWQGGPAALKASSGGVFTASVNGLSVGDRYEASPGFADGVLDIAQMDSCSISAATVRIGAGMDDDRSTPKGQVFLPAGTMMADDLTMGDAATGTVSTLDLDGTDLTVTVSMTLKNHADVTARVYGESSGITLDVGSTLDIQDGAALSLEFAEPATDALHWGLRWAGNYESEIQALVDAGKITWDATALGAPVEVFAADGYTYVGVPGGIARITQFEISDASSGSTLYTNDPTVAVSLTGEPAEGEGILGFALTEVDAEPVDGWDLAPATYTITTGFTGEDVTLYAWMKDTAGNVVSRSASIYYYTDPIVVSNAQITEVDATTISVSWDTNGPVYGGVKYKAAGDTVWTAIPEAEALAAHQVQIAGIQVDTTYEVVIYNLEQEESPMYYPEPAGLDGDANGDCKVNIIDLIYIRNRLNQDVNSNDNAPADVNGDGKINIIDLIYVRNRLNTKCP